MAYEFEPFQIALVPGDTTPNTIQLRGDLEHSHDVELRLKSAVEQIHFHHRSSWIVKADEIRIVPGGEIAWINFAQESLCDAELVYKPSQLTLILQYDEKYSHPRSVFKEY